jgi:hypothetical protein
MYIEPGTLLVAERVLQTLNNRIRTLPSASSILQKDEKHRKDRRIEIVAGSDEQQRMNRVETKHFFFHRTIMM